MENDHCPICDIEGQHVSHQTVKNLVKTHLNVLIEPKDTYFICTTKTCDVVYYNQSKETLFYKNELKVPVHFKKGADPKYICYCNHVTEQEIIDAVINKNAMTVTAVVRITGAMDNCNCEVNNPRGKCCAGDIKKVIEQTKNNNRG